MSHQLAPIGERLAEGVCTICTAGIAHRLLSVQSGGQSSDIVCVHTKFATKSARFVHLHNDFLGEPENACEIVIAAGCHIDLIHSDWKYAYEPPERASGSPRATF